jgi:hypothetical protein
LKKRCPPSCCRASSQLLAAAVRDTLATCVQQAAQRRLADRRRQLAEEMLELRGLRGKSGAKVR